MRLGFITNIESALNLDIDFNLSESERRRTFVNTAFSKEYSYQDEGSGIFKTGIAHRVRLKGIGIIKQPRVSAYARNKITSDAYNEFRNAVERCGGFIHFHITEIDVFGRVIADIFDPVTGKRLNDIYLQSKYSQIYNVYSERMNE